MKTYGEVMAKFCKPICDNVPLPKHMNYIYIPMPLIRFNSATSDHCLFRIVAGLVINLTTVEFKAKTVSQEPLLSLATPLAEALVPPAVTEPSVLILT